MRPPILRRDAAQSTLDRFKDQPFELGTFDCAKMVAHHLKALGQPIPHGAAGSYKTAISAKRALGRLGYANLIEAMDAHFPRIAPARARTGDVLALREAGDNGLGCLAIYLGNGMVLNYVDGQPGAITGRLIEVPEVAWDVLP